MTLNDLEDHFSYYCLKKLALPFRSMIVCLDDVAKDGIADDLE